MIRTISLSLMVCALAIAGCAPTHRLAEVQLEGERIAVTAPMPPDQRLVFGPWPYVTQPVEPPPGEVRRRFDASRAAQSRLDSAAARVDIPEVLARHALLASARAVGFSPENDPDAATLVLDVRLLGFSFTAASFDHAVRALIEMDAMLYRADTREVVWERRFRERLPVDPALFEAPQFGRRLTPRDMTRLSTDAFALGLERLTVQAADRVATRLRDEYRAARR